MLSSLCLSRHTLEYERQVQEQKQEQHSQEMLENATMIAPFGKEVSTAQLQSHVARTQDMLVGDVENAEVAEIKRAVFGALTRLRAAEINSVRCLRS